MTRSEAGMSNKLKQAAQQALEALEVVPYMSNKDDYVHLQKTIASLRQALEQQADEPVNLPSPEFEKVAQWMMERGYATGHGDSIEDLLNELDWQIQERERPWVGLTDEEKHYLNEVLNLQGRFPIIDVIEAKLKEKNA